MNTGAKAVTWPLGEERAIEWLPGPLEGGGGPCSALTPDLGCGQVSGLGATECLLVGLGDLGTWPVMAKVEGSCNVTGK